jgi:diguanylate cyclase (GGDEF)-like protein/putative nucleotidyltransferase with HDIG domain
VALSNTARFYIGGVICAGLGLLLGVSLHWSSADPTRFLVYFLLTAVASGMKVSLPGVTGTMSVSFILILSAVIRFSLGEVVDIAVISALIQCFWHAKKRPRMVHVLFNTGLMVLSTGMAYAAYHVWPSHFSVVLPIAAGTCTFFLTNTISVAGVIAVTEGKPLFATWKNSYFWSFPYYLLGASIAASMSYVTKFNWEIALALLPMLFLIYRSYTLHVRQLEEEKRTAETMAALHLRTIETLALAIEAKDQTTADHLKRVQIYSSELSKDLGLLDAEERALQAASILHDIGKIAVPDYIISKPGRLTPDEFERMKIHPIVGAEIVERIEFPYPVAPIVRAHHEKWDGSGYPFGLRGHEIPIGARILSVVDCFDALASDRQYRKALPLEQAFAVVAREAGKSFDPQIVELLGRRYLELEELAQSKPSHHKPQLSVDVRVTRGESPDAGFEAAGSHHDTTGSEPSEGLASGASAPASAFDELTSTLGISLSLTETLGVMCSRVSTLVPADAVTIYLVDGGMLVPKYVYGENFKLLMHLRIGVGEGLVGWVAENHKAILNGNPAVEPGYRSGPNPSCVLNSVLAIPLQTTSGTIGVLALYRAERDAFSRDHLQDLVSVGDKISLAVESSLQQEHRMSFPNVDVITGLPNTRALFSNIAAEIAKRRGAKSTLTVMFCGLEGVATVHESFGRSAAEQALRSIAEGFRETCRDADYLAWRGGDDFVFVLPGLAGEAVDARISALERLVREAGLKRWATDLLSISAGAVEFPMNGDTAEILVAEAEKRMLAVRRSKMRSDADSAYDSLVRMRDSIMQDGRMPGGTKHPTLDTESAKLVEISNTITGSRNPG